MGWPERGNYTVLKPRRTPEKVEGLHGMDQRGDEERIRMGIMFAYRRFRSSPVLHPFHSVGRFDPARG